MPPPVIESVLSQHAEEAAFLWLLRDRLTVRPDITLAKLTSFDDRLEGHLDGLRVAGEHGWKRMWEEFEAHPEPGESFAAAVLALEAADTGALQGLLAAADARPPLARAVASAVGWLTDDAAALALPLLHAWDTPAGRRVGLAGAAVRRAQPGGGALDRALRDPDPRLRARTAEAVGELGDGNRLPAVRDLLKDRDPEVRFAAAWAVARLSTDPAAVAELQTIALTESRHRLRSAVLAVRRLEPPAAARWVRMLQQTPGCERVAVHAAGALGDPAAVPWLLGLLGTPPLARLAGEALGMITGVHVSDDKLDAPPPEGFEAGPTEDPDEGPVDLDPDAELDWPDPEKVGKWWAANRGRFPPGVRHLCGKPITPDHLRAVLRDGYQRQRAAAALEWAVRHPREPLFEVRAPGWRQRPA